MTIAGLDRVRVALKRGGLVSLTSALALVSAATLVRVPFQSVLGDASPFLFYWPCVVVTSVLWGCKPGLLATLAAAVQADYFWMQPQHGFGLNKVEALQLVTFCFGSGSIAWLSEWWQREKQGKEVFRATLAHAGEAIVTTDRAGRVVFLNAAAQILLGIRSDDAIGQTISSVVFLLPGPGLLAASYDLQKMLVDDKFDALPLRLLLLSREGDRHRVHLTISRIVDVKGQTNGAVLVLHRWSPPGGAGSAGRVGGVISELPA